MQYLHFHGYSRNNLPCVSFGKGNIVDEILSMLLAPLSQSGKVNQMDTVHLSTVVLINYTRMAIGVRSYQWLTSVPRSRSLVNRLNKKCAASTVISVWVNSPAETSLGRQSVILKKKKKRIKCAKQAGRLNSNLTWLLGPSQAHCTITAPCISG